MPCLRAACRHKLSARPMLFGSRARLMHHEQLWAPWRLAYIKPPAAEPAPAPPPTLLPGGEPACFICRAAVETARDRENLVVRRSEHSIVILNRFPYNNGHL